MGALRGRVSKGRAALSFWWCRPLKGLAFSTTAAHEAHHSLGDITRKNFWQALEAFKVHLQSADFVAIDLELSGIHSIPPPHRQPSDVLSYDVERCYWRLKHLAEKFAVVQAGVALFQQQNNNPYSLIAHPYNFYLYPRNELTPDLPAPTFACEVASLEFLASHGFDFNLCVKHGVSYLSKAQEADARLKLAGDSYKVQHCECVANIRSTSDIIFCERLRVELDKWLKSKKECSVYKDSKGSWIERNNQGYLKGDTWIFTALNGFELKASDVSCNQNLIGHPHIILQLESHHQVCLARRVLDLHFEDLAPVLRSNCMSQDGHELLIIFYELSVGFDSLQREEQRSQYSRDILINEAIGFRHIIDAIISSKKLVVGHNCALDFSHIHSKFISPLPTSFASFSASLHSHFPSIIDTKFLAKSEGSLQPYWARKHKSLSALYSDLCQKPDHNIGYVRYGKKVNELSQIVQVDIMPGFKRYQEADFRLVHEAGYDAFMTGSVFAQICLMLQVDLKQFQNSPLGKSAITDHINCISAGSITLNIRTGDQLNSGKENAMDCFSRLLKIYSIFRPMNRCEAQTLLFK